MGYIKTLAFVEDSRRSNGKNYFKNDGFKKHGDVALVTVEIKRLKGFIVLGAA